MPSTVFLTGCTGFLGSAVLQELLSADHRVRCLVRRKVTLPEGAEPVPGDLADGAALRRGMEGCSAVLHVAAMVRDWVPAARRDEYRQVNVEGLANIMAASRDAGVPRFLYTSSFFALGPTDALPGHIGDESMPLRSGPFRHPYEASKSEARALFLEAVEAGLAGIALYPAVIYGPGPMTEGNLVARMIDDFQKRKVPGIPGSGDQLWCFARVADVARGHRLALEEGKPGEGYLLGGENCTLGEFFARLERCTQVRGPRLRVPVPVLSLVGRLQEAWASLTGRAPQLTSGSARLYRHHWGYCSQKARRELGYEPVGLDEGVAETLAWLNRGR